MKKLDVAKKAASLIVGSGVTCIVKGIIETNVETTTAAQKLSVAAAGVAIGGVVAEATSDYTDRMIDEAVNIWLKLRARKDAVVTEVENVND